MKSETTGTQNAASRQGRQLMYRFTITLAHTLALFTSTALVGCDDVENVDIDELDADDIELRDQELPVAGIPFDWWDISIAFGAPMQVPAKYKPKDEAPGGLVFAIHPPTNPDYQWTVDPTGAPGIIADAQGDVPYSGEHLNPTLSVCEDFLAIHPTQVPVTTSLSSCAAVEQGCCDYICHIWGGDPIVENGQNKVGAVSNDTFDLAEDYGKEMMKGTYVTEHMLWDTEEENGGFDIRQRVCQCECTFEYVLELQSP
jgi:hypothetical protein